MTQTKSRRLAVALLLGLGALAFSFGINWGLSSTVREDYLKAQKGDQDAHSVSLTGAGIDHLAGGWEEDRARASDVELHPITDRSVPVTLLDNPVGLSAKQIVEKSDAKLAAMLKESSALRNKWTDLFNANKQSPDIAPIQTKYVELQAAIDSYVQKYNQDKTPGYREGQSADPTHRARILRRYRLYSDQPDEMITLRTLAQMHPGEMDFDPRLYQYGGLWIYPVAGIIKAAGTTDWLTVTSDRGRYLDHPEEFAKFYILMRAYSAFWGLIGVLTVFHLVRRAAGGLVLPIVAGICFIGLPIVLSLSHEAKPHLPGMVLILLAVAAASKYVETGKLKWILWTAIGCGAAAGMVLSAATCLILIPVMCIVRRDKPGKFMLNCVIGTIVACAIYFATNPYVATHLVSSDQRKVLVSNFGNTKAMYEPGPIAESAINAVKLIALGTGAPLALLGLFGVVVLLVKKPKPPEPWDPNESNEPPEQPNAFGMGWLIGSVALIVAIQCAIFCANKPAEYARFFGLVDVALMLAGIVAISRISTRNGIRAVAGALMILIVAAYGASYLIAFHRDAGDNSPRFTAAKQLQEIAKTKKDKQPSIGITEEPAPYCMPPVDLYRWKIVLLPKDNRPITSDIADVVVTPEESFNIFNPMTAPITWADARFKIEEKK